MRFVKNKTLIIAAAILIVVSWVSLSCIYRGQKNIMGSDLVSHDSYNFEMEKYISYDDFVGEMRNTDTGNYITAVAPAESEPVEKLYINNHEIDVNESIESLAFYFGVLDNLHPSSRSKVLDAVQKFCEKKNLDYMKDPIKSLTVGDIDEIHICIHNERGVF